MADPWKADLESASRSFPDSVQAHEFDIVLIPPQTEDMVFPMDVIPAARWTQQATIRSKHDPRPWFLRVTGEWIQLDVARGVHDRVDECRLRRGQ